MSRAVFHVMSKDKEEEEEQKESPLVDFVLLSNLESATVDLKIGAATKPKMQIALQLFLAQRPDAELARRTVAFLEKPAEAGLKDNAAVQRALAKSFGEALYRPRAPLREFAGAASVGWPMVEVREVGQGKTLVARVAIEAHAYLGVYPGYPWVSAMRDIYVARLATGEMQRKVRVEGTQESPTADSASEVRVLMRRLQRYDMPMQRKEITWVCTDDTGRPLAEFRDCPFVHMAEAHGTGNTPNVRFVDGTGDRLHVVTNRAVPAGAELTTFYGDAYSRDRVIAWRLKCSRERTSTAEHVGGFCNTKTKILTTDDNAEIAIQCSF